MRPLSRPLNAEAWRDVYGSALFEADIAKLPERIAKAEEALALRARELAHANGDNVEEEEALDNAMYCLNALRNVYRREQAPGQPHTEAA